MVIDDEHHMLALPRVRIESHRYASAADHYAHYACADDPTQGMCIDSASHIHSETSPQVRGGKFGYLIR